MTSPDTDPAELPPLTEAIPPLDAVVAIEWWFEFDADGAPELDSFHGFHDAERVTDGPPPTVRSNEFVTRSGTNPPPASPAPDDGQSRYLFTTVEGALDRGLDPCIECYPAYATKRRLDHERGDKGMLTEPGVDGAVFLLHVRRTLSSEWEVDSVHDTYTSLLYRCRAIRQQVGSAADRLRLSYQPVRRCDYGSFDAAMGFDAGMPHVAELQVIQPTDVDALRDAVGATVLVTPIKIETQFAAFGRKTDAIIHQAEDAPCGYEQALETGSRDDTQFEELRELRAVERETLADVLERGVVGSVCEECFPDVAAWVAEANADDDR